jgi:DNA-binding transcriptional LysR family regulator
MSRVRSNPIRTNCCAAARGIKPIRGAIIKSSRLVRIERDSTTSGGSGTCACLNDGYDVAMMISAGALPDSELIASRLGTSYSVLCASPAYLRRHGRPERVEELGQHACLQAVTPFFPANCWSFESYEGTEDYVLPPTCLRTNNADALSAMLCDGAGIGALPVATALSALRSGALVRVLPGHRAQTATVSVVYALANTSMRRSPRGSTS